MAIITVRNKKKRIHIMFRWRGIQYNLGTRYYCQRDGTKNCTCKSCHNARLMSQAVQDEIDRDKFKIGEFFPEHTEAQHISILNNNIIFNDFMKDYVENGAFQYSTRKNYRSMVKLMSSHFKSMLITEITRAHVKHYRDWLVRYKTSNKTINNRLGLLSSVFKDAVDAKRISENPAKGLFLKVKRLQIEPFTPKEVRMILDNIDEYHPKMTLYFAIGFFSGMRTGEILALNREDFDLANHKIKVCKTLTVGRLKDSTKTGEDRFVDITEPLDPYIAKHFKMMETQESNPNRYLFINQYQKRIVECTTMAEWYWRPALKRLNINYRQPYHMRHTFACQSIAAGEDLNWIKNMLGHETLEMLLRTYGNWLIKREGRAGNKLNGYFNELINENETSKN